MYAIRSYYEFRNNKNNEAFLDRVYIVYVEPPARVDNLPRYPFRVRDDRRLLDISGREIPVSLEHP